jgi:hypothetical protein
MAFCLLRPELSGSANPVVGCRQKMRQEVLTMS